ncbi:DeoR/GlpR family DNA-binding transcription regulator [Kitasatospora sp. NBC_01246]|uniref:DeoR/GlpR family DNA-binding transcription regulator n=1 Tax=Kitasatospora sp. NBC_01246 TaxID=2903570 RepID=UPI002E36D3DE|nr:DeoR/GlpR family DNA-binding transcription regulator [Kitasatospora sp. NBC_01246]
MIQDTRPPAALLAEQRRRLIHTSVREHGTAVTDQLAHEFGVSAATVRRDLCALAEQGLLHRTRGGAVRSEAARGGDGRRVPPDTGPLPNLDVIARAAAALVRPGDVVGLGAGPATYAVARHLTTVDHLAVVTNSLRIARVFTHPAGPPGVAPTAAVTLTGGLRTASGALVGPIADQAVRSTRLDLLLLDCRGITRRGDLTLADLTEAATQRAFLHAARRVVLVADRSRWSSGGLAVFGTLDQVDVLVTGTDLPAAQRAAAARRVGTLLVVDAAGGASAVRR